MSQELSPDEVKEIRKFIIKQCANYDRNRKGCVFASKACFASDTPQINDICRYFRSAVLPTNRILTEMLSRGVE